MIGRLGEALDVVLDLVQVGLGAQIQEVGYGASAFEDDGFVVDSAGALIKDFDRRALSGREIVYPLWKGQVVSAC